jgi:hypothetical protein
MNGIVDRRNDPAAWTGPVRWARLKLKTLPTCDDCIVSVHEAGGIGTATPLQKARSRRTCGQHKTVLCDFHKGIWLEWVPGQMTLG